MTTTDATPRVKVQGLDRFADAVRRSSETMQHIGDAAGKVSNAADTITAAMASPKITTAARTMRVIGAASFARLLNLIFH